MDEYTTWRVQNNLDDNPENRQRFNALSLKPYQSTPKPELFTVVKGGRYVGRKSGSYKDPQGNKVSVTKGQELADGAPKKFRQINPDYSTGPIGGMFLGAQLGAEIGKGEDPMFRLGAVLGGAIGGLFNKDFGEKVKYEKQLKEWEDEQKVNNITSGAEDRRARASGTLLTQAIDTEIKKVRLNLAVDMADIAKQQQGLNIKIKQNQLLDEKLETLFNFQLRGHESAKSEFNAAKKDKLVAMGIYESVDKISDNDLKQFDDSLFIKTDVVALKDYDGVSALRSTEVPNYIFGYYDTATGDKLKPEDLKSRRKPPSGKTTADIELAYKQAQEIVDKQDGTIFPILKGYNDKNRHDRRASFIERIASRLLAGDSGPMMFSGREEGGRFTSYVVDVRPGGQQRRTTTSTMNFGQGTDSPEAPLDWAKQPYSQLYKTYDTSVNSFVKTPTTQNYGKFIDSMVELHQKFESLKDNEEHNPYAAAFYNRTKEFVSNVYEKMSQVGDGRDNAKFSISKPGLQEGVEYFGLDHGSPLQISEDKTKAFANLKGPSGTSADLNAAKTAGYEQLIPEITRAFKVETPDKWPEPDAKTGTINFLSDDRKIQLVFTSADTTDGKKSWGWRIYWQTSMTEIFPNSK